MNIVGKLIGSMGLAAAMLLAGCGGGDSGRPDQQAGQGVGVGEQNGTGPVTSEFISAAQAAGCAATRNRLYVIDQKMVFWDRTDLGCYDASYQRTLYGATIKDELCSTGDSFGGPVTKCKDEQQRAMFETILHNLDQADLGLGSGHKVEALSFLPKPGSALAFQNVASDPISGVVTPKQVVVKDAAAWTRLWAEHTRNRSPAPALPQIDFGRQMLLAVFSGEHANGCRAIGIVRVGVNGAGIAVEYDDRDVTALAICTQAAGSPMHVIAIDRIDAQVGFVSINPAGLAFKSLDLTTRSGVRVAKNVVIKDGADWFALWSAHGGANSVVPDIDFGKSMVIAVFMGAQANGCYSTTIGNVYRSADTINVVHVDAVPGPAVVCTLDITTPAHLIVADRSDLPVTFASEIYTVR